MTEEATALLKGPLFSAVWAGELPELQTAQEHEAYTAGGPTAVLESSCHGFKRLENRAARLLVMGFLSWNA